jgi:hypothetical protein
MYYISIIIWFIKETVLLQQWSNGVKEKWSIGQKTKIHYSLRAVCSYKPEAGTPTLQHSKKPIPLFL